jgi:hypothetical protein
MFAYLVIVIELAILYLVFWIVFLREPRQKEIRADLWGNYGNPPNNIPINDFAQPNYLIEQNNLEFYLPDSPIIPKPSLFRKAKPSRIIRRLRLTRQALSRHAYCPSCSRCPQTQFLGRKARSSRRHWQIKKQNNISQASRPIVEAFLLSLNHVLNRLSVKLP